VGRRSEYRRWFWPQPGYKLRVLISSRPCDRTADILDYCMLAYLGLTLTGSKVVLPHDVVFVLWMCSCSHNDVGWRNREVGMCAVCSNCPVYFISASSLMHLFCCVCAKDVFFYSLVYDSQQKSLIADHGEIRVGQRYQVDVIPDKLESRTCSFSRIVTVGEVTCFTNTNINCMDVGVFRIIIIKNNNNKTCRVQLPHGPYCATASQEY